MPYSDPAKQQAYQAAWVAARRAEYLADKACVVCRSTIDLQIDHIDRSKKLDHKVWSWSAVRRNAELAKCQVLCDPCHKDKTRAENLRPITHGTPSGWKRGCHCDLCSARHLADKRDWRAARRAAGLPVT